MNIIEKLLKKSGFDSYLEIANVTEIKAKDLKSKTLSSLDKELGFYILSSGYIDLYYPDKEGRNHIAGRIYVSDYQMGGFATYLENEYNTLNNPLISFSKEARILKVDEDKGKKLLEDASFLRFILAKKLQYNNRLVMDNYYRGVFTFDEYLAYTLYHYSTDSRYKVRSYTHFARLLKCNRATLYRGLDKLERTGLITRKKNEVKVEEMEELKKIFEEYI